MKAKKTVLLTGANGFIGTQIARRLIHRPDTEIVALVRARSQEEAVSRLHRAWWSWPEIQASIGSRVKAVAGDVSCNRLGLESAVFEMLVKSLTHIIHCAAVWRFDCSDEEFFKVNVQGTANIIDLAKSVKLDHGLERFSYVSTAYVNGRVEGPVSEAAFTDRYGFFGGYEQSKFESERLVQLARDEVPISVFRPTMVVGDSKTGEVKTFNTLYLLLRLYLKGKIRFLPMNPEAKINIIPVDYVAEAVSTLTFRPAAQGLTFHLSPAIEALPTARELAEYVRRWTLEEIDLKLPQIRFLPVASGKILTRLWKTIRPHSRYTGLLEAFGLYFEGSHLFLRDNTNRLLGSYKFDWKEVLSAILGYAVYYGFLHRSERTVHEQIRFRLKSKGLPVSLYDIVKGKVVHRSNQGICKEIIKVSTALLKMGVKKGDKVALVGLNSVRYFVLDVAISLVGAVSVPIYYTSAPSEVEEILKDCNAQIFFVGFTKILDRLDEIRTTISVISFCRSPLVGGKTKVLPWDEFLSLGEEEHESFVPIAFSDLATIRYTSGSSGEAKGVCFHHGNIRWLVEAVAQVFPWKMRNKEVSYLSFLPLNHVVEGLIGAYSPFYAPAPLKIYFLEDFRGLQAALPLVRPTVFFSIPRFYEKLWHVLEESRLGKIYLHTSSQLVKNLLQPFLRRVLLTKSGLDRCEQLIVGSAPSNEKLLFSFKELGVEVHDAYGLTEAPLVTINRVGRNHIGTVGQPLPQTQIKEAEDGEILVKGPQVMQGYHTKTTCRLIDGAWLPTGDLGKVGEKGDLIIYGRKKNLIATSYGKKISPYKIESMLKELSGVDQAMLIGELKPYISALVWSGQAEKESGILDSINKGIIEINTKVSHPEQIHRWVILKNDLSIEQGDLTPNFKLKRRNISRRFGKIIETLYQDDHPAGDPVLSFGRSEA